MDCTRRITAVDGALQAIVERMQAADMQSRTSKDLAEQCVKVCIHNIISGSTCICVYVLPTCILHVYYRDRRGLLAL